MKYDYKFATGTETVELDEKWVDVLNEMDNQDFNNWQTENRRRISLNELGVWIEDPNSKIEELFSEPSFLEIMKERLPMAMEQLKPSQREIIRAIYFDKIKQEDYAKKLGINQSNVSRRLATAEKNLKKFLQKTA